MNEKIEVVYPAIQASTLRNTGKLEKQLYCLLVGISI
jgi:hypothetical protein